MQLKKDKIHAIMKDKNETQSGIGERLGVSHQLVSAWINGVRNPKFCSVQRIADALNCTVFDIAEFEDSAEEVAVKNESSAVSAQDDFNLARINEIYTCLDRAGRAELLASAEQIAKRDGVTVIPQAALPLRDEEKPASGIQRKHGPMPTKVVEKIMNELDNPTGTPRGKEKGIPIISIKIECPTCHKAFYAPRMASGQKIACPACGTHVIVP